MYGGYFRNIDKEKRKELYYWAGNIVVSLEGVFIRSIIHFLEDLWTVLVKGMPILKANSDVMRWLDECASRIHSS